MKIVEMKCKNCGSIIELSNDRKEAICPYCNNKFLIEKDIETIKEENNEKNNKKLEKVALIILICGLVIGISLIIIGIFSSSNDIKNSNINKNNKIVEKENKLKEIKEEKEELEKQYNEKEKECDSLSMNDPNWYANTNECERESSSIKDKIDNLEIQAKKIERNEDDDSYITTPLKVFKNASFFLIGGDIIGSSCFISLIIFLVSKKRR